MSDQQIELPYLPITAVANRETLRSNASAGRQVFWVDHKIIKVRDGFNIRKEYKEIPELALFIEFNGIPGGPLTIDMMPDGKVCYVEMGHRRLKAIDLLLQKFDGKITKPIDLPGIRMRNDVLEIECFVNDLKVDELTRLKRQLSSNNGHRYTTIEVAELCNRMKTFFSLSDTDIARELGLSRQHVGNMLIIAGQSDQMKQAITNKDITPTAAVSLVRKIKDSDKVAELIQEAVSSSKPITVDFVKKIEGETRDGEVKGEKVEKTKTSEKADRAEKVDVFDETRNEIRLCNNVIKNLDKIENKIEKLGPEHEQLKKDLVGLLGFAQKDMAEVRLWVNKIKKH